MALIDLRFLRALVTLTIFGLALIFVWLAWKTLVTFLFAILFAYLLEPAVAALEARRIPRIGAVSAIYTCMLGALAIFIVAAAPTIAHQARFLANNGPSLVSQVASGQIAAKVGEQHGWSYESQWRVHDFLANHSAQIWHLQSRAEAELASLASHLVWVFLVPVVAIFFLLEGDGFSKALIGQMSGRYRQLARGLLKDLHEVLARYIRAQLALTLLAMAVYMAGFWLLGVPGALALGAIAGALEFIPLVGALSAAALALLTTILLNGPHLVGLLIFLGVWRLIQDYVISPRIMGGQVKLHPLAVLFGVLAGGEVGGVIGIYLSVPAMACLRVVWSRWRAEKSLRSLVT